MMAQQSKFETSKITKMNSQNHTKGDIMKSRNQEEEIMEREIHTKTEIDLKLDKINSDTKHGFEKVGLKFEMLMQKMDDGFEKQRLNTEKMLSEFKSELLTEQKKDKKEFTYWFVGLLVSSIIGLLAIIVTILTTK